MFGVSVGGEPAREAKAVFAARDQIENCRPDDCAENLRDDIGQNVSRRKSFSSPETDRHRRIKVRTGNMPDGVSHRQNRHTEGERDARETDAEAGPAFGKSSRQNRAATTS